MRTEVYRSFEGKLDVSQPRGYIITQLASSDCYEIEFLSIASPGSQRIRVPKELVPDMTDICRLTGLIDYVRDGMVEGSQYFYNGRWYSEETIKRIQRTHLSSRWWQFVPRHASAD